MSKRNAAVALAEKGFRVFPIEPNGKKPIIANWPERAISDPKRVHDRWTGAIGEERDWNIGILCDDLFVIDIEGEAKGNDPLKTLAAIEKDVGRLPFLVRTPSGGYHAYMRLPDGAKAGNTAKKLWPGTDTRSWHGYVLGAGSDGYAWVISDPDGNHEPTSINDLPVVPQWLIDKCEKPKEKAPVDNSIDWDAPGTEAKATHYLKELAPLAIQGQGGDATAYEVACRLRDFAVSRDMAILLMLEHWNPRCEPPWDTLELDQKVANAYIYAQNTPSVPGSEFEAVAEAPAHPLLGYPIFSPQGLIDPAKIPKREWLVQGIFARKFVTLINAPPGSGKTQWLVQLLLGVTHDRSDVAGFPVVEPTTAWLFNAEDDIEELQRRAGAAIIHYKLNQGAAKFSFGLSSGVEDEFIIAKWDAAKQCVVRNEKAIKAFTKQIVDNKIGLVILDPMADLHEVPESNNDAIKIVVKIFTGIAKQARCAFGIATHSRKLPGASADGHAGVADSVRGGGAQVAKARGVVSLMPMTEKEAKVAKIDLETRGSYLRIDTAKTNLGPTDRGAKPAWFKWEGVPLGNGDNIGVLTIAEIATSRLRRELEVADIVADIVATAGPNETYVSWPKVVKPELMKRTGMSESSARRWLEDVDGSVEVSGGVIRKIKKIGAGGALLQFVASKETEEKEEPEWL